MSLIDDAQYSDLNEISHKLYRTVEEGKGTDSEEEYNELVNNIFRFSPNLNFYHITVPYTRWRSYDDEIADFMNDFVRKKLGIIPSDIYWTRHANNSAIRLNNDFLRPVWNLLDEVLKSSDIDVVVYSGQFDFICSTVGALRWINRLTWDGKREFERANRTVLVNPSTNIPEMFVKSSGHLKMYWVLNAGHEVPVEVPNVALRMLNRILDDLD